MAQIVCVHLCFLVCAHLGHMIFCDNAKAGNNSPFVRVAVIKDAKELKLFIKCRFKMMPLNTDEILHSTAFLGTCTTKPTLYGVKIGGKEYKIYGIRIIPSKDSAIYINNRSFRGEVDIIRQKDQTLLVINHINIEDYLKGVLYHEVSHRWPKAALDAQAIAARTYALYQAGINKDKDYDLVSTVFSQVYGGSISEKYRTNKAILRTKGKILTYNGEILPAFYHATCAGHTEDVSILWKLDLPPLKGVACNFCKRSKHFYWKHDMPITDIVKKLRWNGFLIEDITSIVPTQKDPSGRIVTIQVNTSKGKVDISGKDFRRIIGSDVIRSTNFKVAIKLKEDRPFAYLEGFGWGHGVGMCQWGAYFMAKKGYTAEEILQYYYPGCNVMSLRGTK